MRLIELLARACAMADVGEHREVNRRALTFVLRTWPNVHRFTDGHLTQLQEHLGGKL